MGADRARAFLGGVLPGNGLGLALGAALSTCAGSGGGPPDAAVVAEWICQIPHVVSRTMA
jgi:hypothetical protein